MYEGFSEGTYCETPQVVGKLKHKSIDEQKYSTAKRFMTGVDVYSEKYNVMGKIDIYDRETETLIERKTKIKQIFDGYRYQLYAQYYCLIEMGYPVRKLVLRSLTDNKNYELPIPSEKEKEEFENVLRAMRNFDPKLLLSHRCSKCSTSIYGALGW
jgi:CRISPR-associated protein Cas4